MKNLQGSEQLSPGQIVVLQLKDGSTVNCGVIRVTENEVVYYTGKGLRKIWKPGMAEEEKRLADELKKMQESKNGEQKLIHLGYIAVTKLDDIAKVL